MSLLIPSVEEQEFEKVFGDVQDPGTKAYDEYLLSIIRQTYTHEQIMSGQFDFPIGRGFDKDLADVGRAIGKVAKAAAPFVAMIPGAGTVVGTAMYAVGSVAAGDRIDDVAITTVEQVLPPNTRKAYRQAVEIGYGIARGKRIDDMAIQLARDEAKAQGGDEAVAAFDLGVAAGKGRGLQDAGFRLMGAWVKGNDAGERAVIFANDVTQAAQQGKSIGDFLKDEAAAQFLQSVPAVNQALMLQKAIQYLLDHPELLKRRLIGDDEQNDTGQQYEDPKFTLNWEELAEQAGVPVEAIRAAIICIKEMADGTLAVDPNTKDRMLSEISLHGPTPLVVTALKNLPTLSERITQSAYSSNNASLQKGTYMTTAFLGRIKGLTTEELTGLQSFAAAGRVEAAMNPQVSAGRGLYADPKYKWGFDVGTGVAKGKSLPGPGQTAWRTCLGNVSPTNGGGEGGTAGSAIAMQGFDVAQAMQFGITKAVEAGQIVTGSPTTAAGSLVANGLAGSGAETEVKRNAIAAVATNTQARAGAAQVIQQKTGLAGFFHKIAVFLHLSSD